MFQLYNYYRSSASFRVRIALNLKKINYTDIPIHLLNNGGEQFSPHYQAINPQCLVPALQHHDKCITQSLAIIEYLDELYPEPSLLPKDLYQKALARSFALTIAADVHPLNNLRVLQFLTQELELSEKQKTNWYQHWIQKGFTSLEKQLANYNSEGNFCFGDTPSIADIFLVPQIYNARRYTCDMSAYPRLVQIDAHCQTLSAFKDAWPLDPS